MDILAKDELKFLMEQRGDFLVSVFMPTHRTGADVQQDPIRLRNLLSEAQKKLVANGARPAEAKALLQGVYRTIGGDLFRQERSNGLALFISHPLLRYYQLPFRLEERVVVGDRFMIKPLLPAVGSDRYFYILAISQNDVRFFKCTEFSCNEIGLEGIVPKSRAEALKYDEYGKQVQFHSRTTSGIGGGRRAVVFYGTGAAAGEIKDGITQYFQQVDRGLRKLLRDEKSPLVFAGVDYLFPLYRGANTYQNLLKTAVVGNPEGVTAEKLHEQALNLVKPVFQKSQDEAMAKLRELLGTGFASTNIAEIAPAAYIGKVATLFLTLGAEVWGRYDSGSNSVILHEKPQAGDQDLLDFAAVHTLAQSGVVYTFNTREVAEKSPVAALYRY